MKIKEIKIYIHNNKTDETRIYLDDYQWDNEEHIEYQWFEGNYCCDCNRHLWFERVLIPEYNPYEHNEGTGYFCGNDKYSIQKIELPCGKILMEQLEL